MNAKTPGPRVVKCPSAGLMVKTISRKHICINVVSAETETNPPVGAKNRF